MMRTPALDHRELYRLPWTLPDNAISWLEPTVLCNLVCDGCYRKVEESPHKSLQEVRHELDVLQRYRRSDCISIAGGEPLIYPHIVELVREIRARGLKPVINSNGRALTRGLLADLKEAGVFGLTFHVDSRQNRSGWEGRNELELNELRLHYATMLAEAGGISCSFNATVYAENLHHVPGLIAWAQKHIDIVQAMAFICYRQVVPNLPFDWYAGAEKVPWSDIWYHTDRQREVEIGSTDLVASVREEYPDFAPAAYLNGTLQADAFKWLLTERVGTRDTIFGYLGPRFVEVLMAAHHLRTGTYLSYVSPRSARRGRTALLLFSLLDGRTRRAARNYLAFVARNPLRLFRPAHLQTIMFIQPVDFLADGEQSMCDGCPDITVHQDQLVWSCRMEERKAYGTWLRTVPRKGKDRASRAGA